jgi:ABC-type transport system substrate-binding protein
VAGEPDAAKQKAIYSQLNDILLDGSFIIPLTASPTTLATRPNVHRILSSAHDGFVYTDAWLA